MTGGTNNHGTVFEITPTGLLTFIYNFGDSDSDGDSPSSALVQGSDGSFYGTTFSGGDNNVGTVFKVTPNGIVTTIHSFNFADGADPTSPMILGSDGNLYGVTGNAESNEYGTVFQITPSGTLTTLYSFSYAVANGGGNKDGAGPIGLIEANNGALYGTTSIGGANDLGTVFKLTVPSLSTSARFDFNKDGHPDLLWYNTQSGALSVWNMDDQSVLKFGAAFTQLAPSSGWVPVASPDVNNDGYPDLIWWNKNTGELSAWMLQNDTIINYGSDFATLSDTNWKPVAAADVTGTTWELVFQNTATGDIARWSMNGTNVTGYGPALASLGAGSPWQIVGAPDLDGDGNSDLLFWNSSTGEVSYWLCNLANTQVLSIGSDIAQVQDTSWHLVGTEDTNGDGSSDLIWWNADSGVESRWLLSATTVTGYGGADTQVANTTWQPTAIR